MSETAALQAFIELIRANPQLASKFEQIAAYEQGKGYGEASIIEEITAVCHLIGTTPRLVVDIGGNVGDYTKIMSEAVEAVEIHTFEPSAANLAVLRQRFAGDPRITVAPFAVAAAGGPAELFSDRPGSALGSLGKRRLGHFGIAFEAREPVTAIRFEDYWTGVLGRRPVDVVKLDVEGHEFAALQGFGQALTSIRAVQFEFGGGNIDTRVFFQDFWYFFQEHGYDLFRIAPTGVEIIAGYRELDEHFTTTNYIAVNRVKA
jgi:FkbM family methyltransferase